MTGNHSCTQPGVICAAAAAATLGISLFHPPLPFVSLLPKLCLALHVASAVAPLAQTLEFRVVYI